jgi:hypothetical protein
MDHSSYFVKTKPVDLGGTFALFDSSATPIRNEWCDCGSASITGAWSTETRILLSFNIVLEGHGSTTSVRTNTFFEGVKSGKVDLRSRGNDTAIRLTCVSTGKLERDLAEHLGTGAKAMASSLAPE